MNKPLLAALILGTILRTVNLGHNPPHLTADEAALGYNAYSILKTARDEHGQLLPIVFKSFGDYKPGLYIYTAIPWIAIFGLTETAVRLPSALMGILAILFIHHIALMLFPEQVIRVAGHKLTLAQIAALLLSISPWHVHFSRGAWEANLTLTVTLLAIYLFLRRSYTVSMTIFGFTLWGYQSAKLITPLILCLLFITHFHHSSRRLSTVISCIVIFLVSALPVILNLRQTSGRLKIFSLSSYGRPQSELSALKARDKSPITYTLFHSDIQFKVRNLLERYFNHFSSRFLLFEGDWANPRHATPYHGVIYLVEAVFLLYGAKFLLRTQSKSSIFLIAWLIVSPLPAALSRDSIHAVRSLNLIAPLVLLVALGIFRFLNSIQRISPHKLFAAISLLYSIQLYRFLDLEFIHSPLLSGKYWYYGYKQIVETVAPIRDKYDQIIVNQTYDQPYIFFLFYERYDPAKYQQIVRLVSNPSGDVGMVEKLDNIYFRPLAWSGDKHIPNSLIIGYPLSMDPDVEQQTDITLVRKILNPDKSPAFYIFSTRQQT